MTKSAILEIVHKILHNGHQKPNLRCKNKGVKWTGGLLAEVGLEVTTEGIRTGTGTERWRKRVPNFRGCDAETASAK